MAGIHLGIRIEASPARIYPALSTADGIGGWFTRAVLSQCEEGAPLELRFPGGGSQHFELEAVDPDRALTWRVTKSNDWDGTRVRFELEAREEKTWVRFDHSDWRAVDDHFRDCAMSWAYFLESLKKYVETGRATPEALDA